MLSLFYFSIMEKLDVEAIIFDLGGVIINLDYSLTVEAFRNLGAKNIDLLYSQENQIAIFDAYETGQISSQHFINKVKNFLPSEVSPNQIVAAWNAMILDFPVEKLALLEELSSQYKLFLLSNTNDLHIQKVDQKLKKVSTKRLSEYFQTIYLSHEIRMRKPNAEIFEFVCQKENLSPERTLFIDDTLQHIHGAQSIGLQTHHLIDSNQLISIFS